MIKQIPNIITLSNLFCGLLSIFFIFHDYLDLSLVMIACGAFLDFFDGLTARLLKVSGELGKQLDSLADMVTFGVAPGFLMLHLVKTLWIADWENISTLNLITACLTMSITLFSALRLAKFNIDTRQQYGFIGLPTPANTLLVGSMVWLIINGKAPDFFSTRWFIISFSLLSSYLLVAPISLFALKFKNFTWKDNEWKIAFALIAIIVIIGLKMVAIPIVVLLYVTMSMAKNMMEKPSRT